jgi:hypothetical protein
MNRVKGSAKNAQTHRSSLEFAGRASNETSKSAASAGG